MGNPLVSIIIPCYNYGQYLEEAIESALSQTYKNVEILVVDDGSTDNTVEVASRYLDSLKLISQENMGIIRVCNKSVQLVAGEYFTFLSADDRFEPSYVEELLSAVEKVGGVSFAYCDMQLFGAQSGLIKARPFSKFSLLLGNYINGSALTKRSDYLEVGGYSEDLKNLSHEDWDFWLRMVESGKRGVYLPKPLLLYRRHALASRNTVTKDTYKDICALMKKRHRRFYRRKVKGFGLVFTQFDKTFGISRSPAILRTIDRVLWLE